MSVADQALRSAAARDDDDDDASDDALMRACANDDSAAFATLVRRHEARLRGFLARSLPSDIDGRSEARDLCQEVFLEVWRARHRYTGTGRFVPWILRMARSRATSRGRALAVRRLFARRATLAPADDAIVDDDALARLLSAEDRRRVRQALASLSRADREVLTLRVMWELDYEVIADALGLQPGAVRVRAYRALTRLASALSSPHVTIVPPLSDTSDEGGKR